MPTAPVQALRPQRVTAKAHAIIAEHQRKFAELLADAQSTCYMLPGDELAGASCVRPN